MGAITQTMIEAAYRLGRDIRFGRRSESLAIAELSALGMDSGSAKMYLENYSRLLAGERLTRTMSKASFRTFLRRILEDDGPVALRRALEATFAHCRYYESLGRGSLQGVEAIAVEFRRRLPDVQ